MDGFESDTAELDLALAFAETAAVSDCPETRSRNLANARSAFLRLRDHVLPSRSHNEWQHVEITQKLAELRLRLEQLGEDLR